MRASDVLLTVTSHPLTDTMPDGSPLTVTPFSENTMLTVPSVVMTSLSEEESSSDGSSMVSIRFPLQEPKTNRNAR